MDATHRIKNLSIALEALSHIVGQQGQFNDVENILNEEVRRYWQEKEKETQWPQWPARASTTNTNYDPSKPSTL